VDAEVREDGHEIAGLDRESFRVTDEGKPQTIVYFGHEEEPVDVVLLFDARGAVMSPDVKRIAETAHTALSDLRQGDHIAVMTFGPADRLCGTDLILDFTGDFEEAERSIRDQVLPRELEWKGTSLCPIMGGLVGASQHLLSQPSGSHKRAIIILTDDKAWQIRSEEGRDALHDLWRTDAVVLGVVVHSGEVVIAIGPPYRGVRYAAGKTGGDVLKAGDAADGLREMMHRLRTRYSLYYALPKGRSGKERSIRVQLSAGDAKRYPRAVVRARTGYVVPSSSQ
jgi:hypothetical protein